jgi:hypothetical protein
VDLAGGGQRKIRGRIQSIAKTEKLSAIDGNSPLVNELIVGVSYIAVFRALHVKDFRVQKIKIG